MPWLSDLSELDWKLLYVDTESIAEIVVVVSLVEFSEPASLEKLKIKEVA